MRAIGQWNTAWDPFFELDPVWTDQFFAAAIPIYKSGVIPQGSSSSASPATHLSRTCTHRTRRHIKAALKLGATMEEIMEVLKLCVCRAFRHAIGRADPGRGDCEAFRDG